MVHNVCTSFIVKETWVPDDGHDSYLHIPLESYDPLLCAIGGKVSNMIPILALYLVCAEQAKYYSTMAPPDMSQIETWGVPMNIANALMDQQRTMLSFVTSNMGRAFIADEMALGKMVQAIASMMMYRHEWPLVVFCLSGTRVVCESEIEKWLGTRVHVELLDGTAIDWSSFDIAICSSATAYNYSKVESSNQVTFAAS